MSKNQKIKYQDLLLPSFSDCWEKKEWAKEATRLFGGLLVFIRKPTDIGLLTSFRFYPIIHGRSEVPIYVDVACF